MKIITLCLAWTLVLPWAWADSERLILAQPLRPSVLYTSENTPLGYNSVYHLGVNSSDENSVDKPRHTLFEKGKKWRATEWLIVGGVVAAIIIVGIAVGHSSGGGGGGGGGGY